jgi:hypothetical protein
MNDGDYFPRLAGYVVRHPDRTLAHERRIDARLFIDALVLRRLLP